LMTFPTSNEHLFTTNSAYSWLYAKDTLNTCEYSNKSTF